MRCLRTYAFASVMLVSPATTFAQGPPGPLPPSASAQYSFQSGAGLLVFHVRSDHIADFEAIIARLSEALTASVDPTRQQQAASWRVFRSAESARDVKLYVFFFDPAVDGADYDPVKVLSEASPSDAQAYYERLRAAVVKVERMALTRVR
jgi:hypothetical protein